MDSYKVHPKLKPRYNLGQEVWYIENIKRDVSSSKVRSICFELIQDTTEPLLACVGYKLEVMHMEAADYETFRPFELYESYQIARELAAWHPVTGISKDEWFAAIGDRKDIEIDFNNPEAIDLDTEYDGTEDCELGICCGGISNVRDLLIKCRTDGGLMERDARDIVALLEGHGHANILNSEEFPRPVLKRIFTQLGIQLS